MLLKKEFGFFLILYLLCFTLAKASWEGDSIAQRLRIFSADDFLRGTFKSPDTNLYQARLYYNHYHNGNLGLANPLLIVPETPSVLGFQYGRDYFSSYQFFSEQSSYYTAFRPFTELFFLFGSQFESTVKIKHSQNINKNLNLSAQLNRMRCQGFYANQQTLHNTFLLTANFTSVNKKYKLVGAAAFNGLRNGENGGLRSDTLMKDGPFATTLDTVKLPVNQALAMRKLRNVNAYARQHYFLFPLRGVFISHELNSAYSEYKYEDGAAPESHYPNYYFDTILTNDKTQLRTLKNVVLWNRCASCAILNDSLLNTIDSSGKSMRIDFSAGVAHKVAGVRQYHKDSIMHNLIALASVGMSTRKSHASLNMEYIFQGANKGDVKISGSEQLYSLDSTRQLVLTVTAEQRSPDYIFQRFVSNNYQWLNHFDKATYARGGLTYRLEKYNLQLGVYATYWDRYLYFNEIALPAQYNTSFIAYQVHLRNDLHWRWFTLSSEVYGQHLTDTAVLKLPPLVLKHSFVYSAQLFKRALKFMIGADFFYNTLYSASGYLPVTGQYFLQSKPWGAYPYVDVFVQIRIKTARVFVKSEHFNAGMTGFNYGYGTLYPYGGRALKFGVLWRFSD